MAEEEKTLTTEETPSDSGQSENAVEEVVESEESDEVEPDQQDTTTEPEEETITMSKSEFNKLQEERDNYKKGLLKAKNSSRSLPEHKDPAKEDKDFEWENNEYATKKDLQKIQEKTAIQKASLLIPELDDNWDDIVGFYHARNGKDSEEGIIEDLKDATDLWKLRTGYTPKSNDTVKKTVNQLASDKGINKGNDKPTTPPKKTIIKSTEGMDRWYPKK